MALRPHTGQHIRGFYFREFPEIVKDTEKMNPIQNTGTFFRFKYVSSNRDTDTVAANIEYSRKLRVIQTTAAGICPGVNDYVLIGDELYIIQSVTVEHRNQMFKSPERYTMQLLKVDNPLEARA